jgi:hypothetical protein
MMKKLLWLILILLLAAGIASTVQAGSGSLLCVPDVTIDESCSAGYASLGDAYDAALNGDRILLGAGNHTGVMLEKGIEIKGLDGAVINSGPMHPAGLSQGFRLLSGSDGASINHLIFTVDLAIMNGAAVNYVEVNHNTFLNAIQAVSNWGGEGWNIHHNEIVDLRTRNGGGIGILVADYTGNEANWNNVANNKISGVLHVHPSDGGGYAGSGIVLYSDHRWNRLGGDIQGNVVERNSVSMYSDNPAVVDINAFELTQMGSDLECEEIINNVIRFNDFRGTANQILVSPPGLETCNYFIKNFGENRGHGLHPNLIPSD